VTIAKKALWLAKLSAIQSVLSAVPERDKSKRVAATVVENFNALVADVGKEIPELRDALPQQVSLRGEFMRIGQADISFLDLEILAEQVCNLLKLVES